MAKKTAVKRPDWNEYFMKMAQLVATRTTCIRRGVGAVIVKEKRVLATGYNGVPKGIEHCLTRGCLREKLGIPSGQRQEICRGLHAEQNAFIQAARFGISIKDSVLYCTHQPCVVCAKMLINAGITEVIIGGDYPDDLALEMMKEAKIKITKYKC